MSQDHPVFPYDMASAIVAVALIGILKAMSDLAVKQKYGTKK